jgi:hypothetical protein
MSGRRSFDRNTRFLSNRESSNESAYADGDGDWFSVLERTIEKLSLCPLAEEENVSGLDSENSAEQISDGSSNDSLNRAFLAAPDVQATGDSSPKVKPLVEVVVPPVPLPKKTLRFSNVAAVGFFTPGTPDEPLFKVERYFIFVGSVKPASLDYSQAVEAGRFPDRRGPGSVHEKLSERRQVENVKPILKPYDKKAVEALLDPTLLWDGLDEEDVDPIPRAMPPWVGEYARDRLIGEHSRYRRRGLLPK